MKTFSLIPLLALSGLLACSHAEPVKTQAYATLKDHRTFEYEFPVVWKGVEDAFKNYKILERDPNKVDDLEMKKLAQRKLETDWIYGQSRDKYIEYQVNDSPRKKYLQTRVKYELTARSVLGGVEVTVATHEEIEKLSADGASAGYSSSAQPDSSRANEVLDRIQNSILSAAP